MTDLIIIKKYINNYIKKIIKKKLQCIQKNVIKNIK